MMEMYKIHTCPRKTILVESDSIFNQIDEQRLSKEYTVKVRAFNGVPVNDMYWYLHHLLPKCPDYILLHVGTNDCNTTTADEILCNLLKLKYHVEKTLTQLHGDSITADYPDIYTYTQSHKSKYLIKNFNQLNISWITAT